MTGLMTQGRDKDAIGITEPFNRDRIFFQFLLVNLLEKSLLKRTLDVANVTSVNKMLTIYGCV